MESSLGLLVPGTSVVGNLRPIMRKLLAAAAAIGILTKTPASVHGH